jgi:sporulation protein YlmC with PRC-barrel domain
MNVSTIIGKEVLDKNAFKLGKVTDVEINMPRGTVDYFIVKTGLTKKLYVPFLNIETAGDRVILNVSKDEVGKTPAPAK